MNNAKKLYSQWVEALSFFPIYAKELEDIQDNDEEIYDRFYQDLSFGTAGLRGIMGVGTNRINPFTIGQATQGLASYYKSKSDKPSVAISFDSRNNSDFYAEHAATIFAANGFKVHLFPELAPTPTLSYAVRQLNCDCGVMITASHNPAPYNGYKVYNGEGCQIDNTVADAVLKEIQNVPIFGVDGVKKISLADGLKDGRIEYVSSELMENFCEACFAQALQPEICKKAELNIVYTPLNGAGNIYVQDVFGRLRITNFDIVREQEHPDGNFPTAPYPNPEFPEALELATILAQENNADFLLATDPDADRIAISVKHNGKYHHLNGNSLGILMVDYIGRTRTKAGTLPENPLAVRSIVSSPLFDKVAAYYGMETATVLTGFKYIGELMYDLEQTGDLDRFIMGYEEACGFLVGDHARDKDAIVAAVIICEMIADLKLAGKTGVDRLEEIYEEFGYVKDFTQNISFQGAEGMIEMQNIMNTLRENPPTTVVDKNIDTYLNYKAREKIQNGVKSQIPLGSANVLEYLMEDGCRLIIRPSGTEPKLKIYYSITGKTQQAVNELAAEYKKASIQLAGVEVE